MIKVICIQLFKSFSTHFQLLTFTPSHFSSPSHVSRLASMQSVTINEIVTADYRAARMLDTFGIDFCCSGDLTLEEASAELHLDQHLLEQALASLKERPIALFPHLNYAKWDTQFLVDFIIRTHHSYIRETLPKLLSLSDIVVAKEGSNHPELHSIRALLTDLDQRVKQHLISEEYALFPYLLEMEKLRSGKQVFIAPTSGKLEKSIQSLIKDHNQTAVVLKQIRVLSLHFQPPYGACDECTAWYELHKEFDADMRLHIHLENNILFPRALALEAELTGGK